jgi:hypothetical protein
MASVFLRNRPNLEVNESTRRSLGQLDLENPYVLRLVAACRKLKLKPASPCSLEDVVSHVGIPALKVAFFMRHALQSCQVVEASKKWGRHGWLSLPISHRQMEMLTDERLAEHLREALVELGKIKR